MTMTRRDLLKTGAAAGLAGALGCAKPAAAPEPEAWKPRTTPRQPSVYISHGSPMTAVEKDDYVAALAAFGASTMADAILVVSAHWCVPAPIRVATSARPSTIHDFYNFPKELYDLAYPCPGQPALANHVVSMLRDAGWHTDADAQRGLDHGAWVPLRHSHPKAAVPVVGVSLPSTMEPTDLVELGRVLAPLRTQGVLIIGSGGLTHNFETMRRATKGDVDPWAREFENWVMERVRAVDAKSLTDYYEKAPNAEMAAPTTEHFDPIFVALGAAAAGDKVDEIYTGFRSGNLSLKCFALR
jgi:4,5-DOPA dioxygenase extradiol